MALVKGADNFDLMQAQKLLQDGRPGEAIAYCTQLLAQAPKDGRISRLLGLAYCMTGQYETAVEYLLKADKLIPNDQTILNTLGVAYTELEQHEKAAAAYRKVLSKNPDHASTLFSLASAYTELQRYDEAAAIYQKFLAKNPDHIDALFNLGTLYGRMHRRDDSVATYQKVLNLKPDHSGTLLNHGLQLLHKNQYAEALDLMKKALKSDPANALAAANVLEAEFQTLSANDWAKKCDALMAEFTLTPASYYVALVYRAIAEWLTDKDQAAEKTLTEAQTVRPPDASKTIRNTVVYEEYLARLVDYKKKHPELYTEGGKTVYLTGDSHSLSYQGLKMNLNGEACKISSSLIIGAKAWHIASETPNNFTTALDLQLERLPNDSKLMCAFGEIDCRINEGILPYQKKSGRNLKQLVAEQVARYVAALAARAAKKNLKLIFLAVPAPTSTTGNRMEVIRLFNKELEENARKSGHGFADLYALTLDQPDGRSSGKLHVDFCHLWPEALTICKISNDTAA